MHKYYKTFFLFALSLVAICSSSCFDIFEEYKFNADGSGKATMYVDVSKMMAFMDGMGSILDSTGNGEDQSMDEMFNDKSAIETLKKIPGITNVTDLNDKDKKQVGYSFEFATIEALNSAMVVRGDMGMGQALGMSANEGVETENENAFSYEGKKFHRTLEMKMDPMDSETDEDKQYAEMAMMMFKDAKYNIKYSFPRSVKKIKDNKSALIGADGKSVTLENNLRDLLEGKANMNCDIRLK